MTEPASAVLRRSPFALFAGHPRGLPLLFFTELWERFSFYGMRVLLVLYLTKILSFTDENAFAVYGAYTALVYVGPILGGLLADRILGARRAVTFGGILIALGHFTLALSGLMIQGGQGMTLFYVALGLLIIGEAFFKPNISTLVGKLYGEGDPRRDAGFTLFYMGINLGAFFGEIICGYLAENWGWHYGFGIAGIGMLAGLVIFRRGIAKFPGLGEPPDATRLGRPLIGPLSIGPALYAAGLLAVFIAAQMIQSESAVRAILGLAGGLATLALVGYAVLKSPPIERDRIFVALILCGFAVVFIVLFEQAGSSLNLFTERNVDHDFFGLALATPQYQSFNPLFILLLSPFFSSLWPRLQRRGRAISTIEKFAIGLALLGAGFAVLVIAAGYGGRTGIVASYVIVLAYLLHTMAELCIQPIGLSMITKLSPQAIVGYAMGIWFLASAAGQYLAAELAKLASVDTNGKIDPIQSLHGYTNLFSMLAVVAFFFALMLVALRGPVQKLMHGID